MKVSKLEKPKNGENRVESSTALVSARELYEEAIKTWGADFQLEQFIEECAEAILAVKHLKRFQNKESKENFIESLADLEIMLDQMKILAKREATGETVEEAKTRKLQVLDQYLKEYHAKQSKPRTKSK